MVHCPLQCGIVLRTTHYPPPLVALHGADGRGAPSIHDRKKWGSHHSHGGHHGYLGWAVVLPVCEQPIDDLPSDTHVVGVLMSLLEIQV